MHCGRWSKGPPLEILEGPNLLYVLNVNFVKISKRSWCLIGRAFDLSADDLGFESHYRLSFFSFMADFVQNLGLIRVKES